MTPAFWLTLPFQRPYSMYKENVSFNIKISFQDVGLELICKNWCRKIQIPRN